MADVRLLRRLEHVASRLRRLRSLNVQTAGWGLLAVALVVLFILGRSDWLIPALWIGGLIVIGAGIISGRRKATDQAQAALLVEQRFPELDSRLFTALQQEPQAHVWGFSFLQSELLSEVFEQMRRQDWRAALPSRRFWWAHLRRAAAFATCLAIAFVTIRTNRGQQVTRAEQSPPAAASANWDINIEPGNVELERGTSVLVLARFPGRIPENAELVAHDPELKEIRVPLKKALDDPMFGGRIPQVDDDLTYHVEFAGRTSPTYTVTTFEYPALLRADADLTFPEYTGMPPDRVKDVRTISVVQGSQLHLTCEVNKALQSAELVDENGQVHPLKSDPQHPQSLTSDWNLEELGERTWRLHLRDDQGRTNRDPVEFQVSVVANSQPDLKITFPSKDLRVSPLQEVALQAEASDDFGLHALGLVYEAPGTESRAIDLSRQAPANEVVDAEHLLAFETLNAEPDDLISYYFYADDIGPDGQTRRSYSDMFFAQVRPFEEIYRQAPAQPKQQQQQQQSGPSAQLLELQKQIVTAAWNILRREQGRTPGDHFVPDVVTLVESQQHVVQLAEGVKARVQDEQLKQFADTAIEAMQRASEEFETAATQRSLEQLKTARASAQDALQALMRMQSREKNVVNAQSQGSGQSAQKNLDQQLKALKLKNDRDRYETERQAQQQLDSKAREALQVLNRLKELARRQEDLNKRLQELQNKLRNAETPQEKAELQRQLKRLEEEQQELLRNLDELRERMNRDENRSDMADARQQVDQTRQRVYRASEALKEGQTSRALTEGTRAQQELDQLKNDFREKTSRQFDDALRQLRADARELAERQRKIQDQMTSPASSPSDEPPSLRGASPSEKREELAKQFEEQRERLGDVLDQTRSLVEKSESSEPLLSKKLYDAMRDIRKYDPERALENAAQLTRYGIAAEAQQLEEQAAQGINVFQKGIEDAASAILGNEEEALRLAGTQLGQLTESIREELDRHQAAQSSDKPAGQQGPSPERPNDTQRPDSGAGERQQNARSDQSQQTGEQSAEQQSPGQTSSQSPGQRNQRDGQQSESSSPGQSSNESSSPPESEPQSQSQSPGASDQGSPTESPSSRQQSPSPSQSGQQRGSQPGNNRDGSLGQPSLTDQLGQLLQEQSEMGGGTGSGPHLPLTGEDFIEWSDRMRDVEEMLPTPELRAQAAAIRDRARLERIEVKRHSKQPNWELVRTSIYGPLLELQAEVAENLARRNPDRNLVPIDRDPVPEKYSELLESYYEELSRHAGEQRSDSNAP